MASVVLVIGVRRRSITSDADFPGNVVVLAPFGQDARDSDRAAYQGGRSLLSPSRNRRSGSKASQ